MKNNIKPVYFEILLELCNEIELIPEQELRQKKLESFLNNAKVSHKLMTLFAYLIERICNGKEANYYFMNITNEYHQTFSINMSQLKYASEKINSSKQLQESIIQWYSGLDNEAVAQYVAAYFNIKNILGIKYDILMSLYAKYNMQKYIEEITLNSFYYEAEKVKKEVTTKKLKSPFLVTEEKGELVYFNKYKGNIASNLPSELLNDFENILVRYKQISIVGLLQEDYSILCYICSTKEKVVSKSIGEKSFTLQNSFRYLLPDLNRVNISIRGYGDYIKLKELKKLDCILHWTEEEMLQYISSNKVTFLFSRNDIVKLKEVYKSKFVISKIKDNGYELYSIRDVAKTVLFSELSNHNEVLECGAKVTLVTISGNLYLVEGK